MKKIIKGNSPTALENWRRGQQGVNCTWNDLPTDVKNSVREHLVKEQGAICCYTGIRITVEESHIEHLKPRTLCTEAEKIAYHNMLAAYPRERSGEAGCPFGAIPRGHWYDEELFVHPLRPNCERRFRFDLNGEIFASQDDDNGASKTIEKLKLKHAQLTQYRKAAVDEYLFSEPGRLSEAKVRELRDKVMEKNRRGEYPAFCFVIEQACEQYLKKLERSRIRRTAIRRQQD